MQWVHRRYTDGIMWLSFVRRLILAETAAEAADSWSREMIE